MPPTDLPEGLPLDADAFCAPTPASIPPINTRIVECHSCGQFHRLPSLAFRAEARCTRCRAVLHRRRPDPLRRTLAWCIASLAIFCVAATLPFMHIDLYGRSYTMVIESGPSQFSQDGMAELGLLVFAFTIAAPALRMAGLAATLILIHARHVPRRLYVLLRLLGHLRVWSMIEVYLLGAFVAYTKLLDIAHVDIGTAGYALAALMLMQAATEASFDPEAAWQVLEARGVVADSARVRETLAHTNDLTAPPQGLLGCSHCGFTILSETTTICPRCGGIAHPRKPNAIGRCWALLAAAVILYIPANLFPILTAISLGQGSPSTILGGVRQLAAAGMYPLALLVFFASITVPAVKLLGLMFLLVSTQRASPKLLRDRTQLYRIVELIGRWSMIDVFMLSILVGLVRLGFVASVTPGPGAIAFASVVVLTMLASMSFDPRLMWDAALRRRRMERLP